MSVRIKIGDFFFFNSVAKKKKVKAAGKVMPYMFNLDKLYFIQKNNGLSTMENRNGILYIYAFLQVSQGKGK